MRIASFLASGTEIAVSLGLLDSIVAISHECDWPPEVLDRPRLSRPRFDVAGMSSGEIDRAVRQAMLEHGSVYEIDEALLERVEPDVILTQAVCEVCAVPTPGVAQVVERRGLPAKVLSLDAHTIGDILESIVQVGAATERHGEAADVVAALEDRMNAVQEAVDDADRPRVLAIEWLDPPFVPGHWVPEMIELAGAVNLAGRAGSHSEQVTWDDLSSLDPDVLVIMPCGYDVESARRDADAVREKLLEIAPRAIAERRAFVVNGSAYFNRSGPRFVNGIEILAGLLHPGLVAAPSPDAAAHYQLEPAW